MIITLTTEGTTSPVTIAQLREWLRVDESEDTLVRRLAVTAANRFEKYTGGRSVLDHTYTIYLDLKDLRFVESTGAGEILELFHNPIQSITSINYFDDDNTEFSMTADVDFHFIPGDHTLRFDNNFVPTNALREHNALKIVYTTGYVIVPDDIVRSLELYAAYLYEHRGDEQVGLPDQIQSYWDSYVIHRFAGAL